MVGVVADSVAEDGFEPDDVVEVEHRPVVLVDVDRFPPVGHDVVGIGVVAPVEPFEDGFDGFAVESHVVLLVRALWIGNGVLDRFLEDESLFGEFLRTPVSEGGVESLVVEPPHIVVEVGA